MKRINDIYLVLSQAEITMLIAPAVKLLRARLGVTHVNVEYSPKEVNLPYLASPTSPFVMCNWKLAQFVGCENMVERNTVAEGFQLLMLLEKQRWSSVIKLLSARLGRTATDLFHQPYADGVHYTRGSIPPFVNSRSRESQETWRILAALSTLGFEDSGTLDGLLAGWIATSVIGRFNYDYRNVH